MSMDSQEIFNRSVEYLDQETTKRLRKAGELPISRIDVISLFDTVRTTIMANFREMLRLAYTKEERAAIVLKMEQLETEIQKRVKPFERENKKAAEQKLLDLDRNSFARIS